MNERIRLLRKKMLSAEHSSARTVLDPKVSFSNLPKSIPERRAEALSYIFENMPVYIGDEELIVGSRTLFYSVEKPECDPTVIPSGNSLLELNTMPPYLNEKDKEIFRGFFYPNNSPLHNVANYSFLLKNGVEGIVSMAENSSKKTKDEFRAGRLRGMARAYRGFSVLISRYSVAAADMAKNEKNDRRRNELLRISEVCERISQKPPRDYYEAAQLFWFAHLGVLCENFRGMSYGRVDQFLYPYYDIEKDEEIRELTACLLIKFSDCCDIYHYLMGHYNSQHNITLGGVTPEGENAVNELTYTFIDALDSIRLEEPEVACRISKKNPKNFLDRLCALSESGLNTLAYYNDDIFVENLSNAEIPMKDARDYAFDLCQDILIPGRCQLFRSADIELTKLLLKSLDRAENNCTFDEFIDLYKSVISEDIDDKITAYNNFEKAITEFADGDTKYFYSEDTDVNAVKEAAAGLMSPLPFTSAMIEGAVEKGSDMNLPCDNRLKQRGVTVSGLTLAVNSLSALRKCVFDEKLYSLSDIKSALSKNFFGYEQMRERLINAPKWGNDDDYADLPGVEIMTFAARRVTEYRTYSGARFLVGFHQPHPVFAGWETPATPDGRLACSPVPVSLSPASGTMKNGATGAMKSAAKLPTELSEWNNCLMLEYSPYIFDGTNGVLSHLISSYFEIGGMQHQPNCLSLDELIEAQKYPELHQDLIVRMWGVSARFVTLSKELQDEIIARVS